MGPLDQSKSALVQVMAQKEQAITWSNEDPVRCTYVTSLTWGPILLTHWATILQTTFPDAFSWMKIYEFRLIFHWTLFLRVKLTKFHHWFRWWLGADKVTTDKPLSEPMMVSLLTHIRVIRSQWVKLWLLLHSTSQEIFTCFVQCCILLWLDTGGIYPYLSGLLPWYLDNHINMIVPVAVQCPYTISANEFHETTMNPPALICNHNKTNQNKTMSIFDGI